MTPEERRIFEAWQREEARRQEADTSLLGRGINTLDLLNTLGYGVGGLISSAGTVIDSPTDTKNWKFYDYKWKIAPSEAMGVTGENTPLFNDKEAESLGIIDNAFPALAFDKMFPGVKGLALDIALDPATYLTFGTSAGVKILSVGGTKAVLSKGGVKTLAKYTAKYGDEAGTLEFMHHMEMSPDFAKAVKASEGIRLQGWGPFAPGFEKELISKETLSKGLGIPGQAWEEGLRKLALSGDTGLQAALKIKSTEEWAVKGARKVERGIQDKFEGAGRRTKKDVDELLKKRKTLLKVYDTAQGAWKWTTTVPFPAYHAMNMIGAAWNNLLLDINPGSYLKGLRTIYKKGGKETYKTALGKTLTGDELYTEAVERNVIGQSGQFDIAEGGQGAWSKNADKIIEALKGKRFGISASEIKLMESLDRAEGVWNKISPARVARKEEDLVRMSLYIDRRLLGDTPDVAKEWVAKTQFSYSLEDMTRFEQNVMKRLIPFWVFEKNNALLQTEMIFRQPGKYAALSKAQQYGAEGEELPEWAWSKLPMGVDEEGRFRYIETPLSTLGVYGSPSSFFLKDLSPFIKLPYEQNYRNERGELVNSYTGDPYENKYGPLTNVAAGRLIGTYKTATSPWGTEDEKFQNIFFGVKTAFTESEKRIQEAFRRSAPGYLSESEKIDIAKASNWQSVISGETTGLGIYNIKQVGAGGKVTVTGQVLLTQDQQLEQERAFRSEAGIAEREYAQQQRWVKIESEFTVQKAGIREMLLDKRGRPVNEAQREYMLYNLQKRANIQYINAEINKLQRSINQLEKFRRGELGRGTKQDRRNIDATDIVLRKYYAAMDEMKAIRKKEVGKNFDLPEQAVAPGERGDMDRLAVRRGKGPELLNKQDIKDKVSISDLSQELRYAVGDIRLKGRVPDSLLKLGITEEVIRRETRDMLDEYFSQAMGTE